MPSTLDQYFQSIADAATAKVAEEWKGTGPAPVVHDGPQEPRATAWSGLAIHPLSVLETSYIGLVQAAEAAAPDKDAAREAAFETLSGFFALSADAPSLLHPDSGLLIADRTAALHEALEQISVLADQGDKTAYARLTQLVQDAADTVALMTTKSQLQFASDNIQKAAAYVDFASIPTDKAGATWVQKHPGGDAATVQSLVKDVGTDLIDLLVKPSVAGASPRALYNIGPFYLYRLMHRFLGGDLTNEMDLTAKGQASGAATGLMHRPDWTWLADWHENQIAQLKASLGILNGTLQRQFKTSDDILRFHLKGGRAMFTALGQPQEGGNDWDTGILINPALKPRDWYSAFAQVNDLVAAFLDKARFGYTALLQQHSADLLKPPPVELTAQNQDDATERQTRNDYSRLALRTEYQGEDAARRRDISAATLATTAPFRPVGVNGELIDIGISTRSSVELSEHWHAVNIQECPGISGIPIPVPTLPYFVDDFSTIIREAITGNTVDRKLAKRLVRLLLVFNGGIPDFDQAVAQRVATIKQTLPKAFAALGLAADTPQTKMIAWGLEAILGSTDNYYLRAEWVDAFDAYVAANGPALLASNSVTQMWDLIGPSIKDSGQRTACQSLFIAQNLLCKMSGSVLDDYATKAAAVYAPNGTPAAHWAAVSQVLETVSAKSRAPDNGIFYLTGGLAGQFQAQHQGLNPPASASLSLGGAAEVYYRPGTVSASDALTALDQQLAPALSQKPYSADLESFNGVEALVLRSDKAIPGLNIAPEHPAVLVVRAEANGNSAARVLDHLDGMAVASTRDLVRLFSARAALCEDYNIRAAGKTATNYLLSDVLGRQLM